MSDNTDLSSLFKKKGKGKKNKKTFQLLPSELEKEPEEQPINIPTASTTTSSIAIPEDSEWVNKDPIAKPGIVLPEQLAATVEHQTILDNVQEETAESRHAKKTLLKTIQKAQKANAAAVPPVTPIQEKLPEPKTYSEKLKLKKMQENDPKAEFPELAPTVNETGKISSESAWIVNNVEEVELENDENLKEKENEKSDKIINKSNKFLGKKKHRVLKI